MNIGVVGSGKMGSAIFRLLSTKSHKVTLLAIDEEEAEKNKKRYLKGLMRSLKKGSLTEDEFLKKKESVWFTHRVEDLSLSEMVIEAIFEDYDEKAAIFRKLESVVDKKAILVTNTSSISINELGKEFRYGERFCGLHFFYPVLLLRLVEIIKGSDTPEELVCFLRDFCESIGKRAIAVDDAPGSVINAILAYYYVEALYILEEGNVLPSRIDELAERFFYVGPCESIDVIGIDFFIGALERAATPGSLLPLRWNEVSQAEIPKEDTGGREGFYIPSLFQKLISENRLGKKISKGIYLYEKDKAFDDAPQFYVKPGCTSPRVGMEFDELIAKRLLYSIFNGSIYSAKRDMVSMEDLDFGIKETLLMKEGPFTMMKAIGEKKLKEDFSWLAENVGKRFSQRDFKFMEE
jgi:3-hydroxybutyryl-CoA dehydrogenase